MTIFFTKINHLGGPILGTILGVLFAKYFVGGMDGGLSPYGMFVTCLITRAHLVPRWDLAHSIFTFVEVGLLLGFFHITIKDFSHTLGSELQHYLVQIITKHQANWSHSWSPL
jgi:hypothetical protein